jgi:hypothetical protein
MHWNEPCNQPVARNRQRGREERGGVMLFVRRQNPGLYCTSTRHLVYGGIRGSQGTSYIDILGRLEIAQPF